jgi:hypothetical protein
MCQYNYSQSHENGANTWNIMYIKYTEPFLKAELPDFLTVGLLARTLAIICREKGF